MHEGGRWSSKEITSERDWNEETVCALEIYEKYVGLMGVWPPQVQTVAATLRWTFCMFMTISLMVSLSLEVFSTCAGTDHDKMDAFFVDVGTVVGFAKLLMLRIKWRHSLALVHSIIDDWSSAESVETQCRIVMKKYLREGKFVSSAMFYLGYTSAFSYLLKFLFAQFLVFKNAHYADENIFENNTSQLGVNAIYLYSTFCLFGTLSISPWICVLLLQIMQIFVSVISHIANDAFFYGLTMHLCGQFEVLRGNYASLDTCDVCYSQKMASLIDRHCLLLRLFDDLEKTFNVIMLVQLLASGLLISTEGFQLLISLKMNDKTSTSRHVVLIMTLFLQLLLYTYGCSQLESKSEQLMNGIYDCRWWNLNKEGMKSVSFIVFHAGIPRQLTAGGFVNMNLHMFKEVVKAAASYLSMMRVMIE